MSPRTLRASSSGAAFWALVILAAVFVGDALLRGDWALAARMLPVALFVLWAAWLLLWHSAVHFDAECVRIVNGVRIHDVPWARVAAVTQRLQIEFELDDGTRVVAYGGPFPTKPGARSRAAERDRIEPGRLLEDVRSAAHGSEEPARHRWDVPVIAVGVVLLAAATVAVLIG